MLVSDRKGYQYASLERLVMMGFEGYAMTRADKVAGVEYAGTVHCIKQT